MSAALPLVAFAVLTQLFASVSTSSFGPGFTENGMTFKDGVAYTPPAAVTIFTPTDAMSACWYYWHNNPLARFRGQRICVRVAGT